MLRHIVFFSAKSPEQVDTIVEVLGTYADIPGVQDFQVKRCIKHDALSNEIDIVLHAVFESEAALAAYKEHPLYLAGTEIVRPIRQLRFAADYEFTPGSD